MANSKNEIFVHLIKGLLDMIILKFLTEQPMHGYQLIAKIRKNFGVRFGPSTIYPLLSSLQKKGYIKGHWDMSFKKPRKVYEITNMGQAALDLTGCSLNFICKTSGTIKEHVQT